MFGILIAAAILFFVLTPGVVLTLPPGSGIYAAAAVHALVFAAVLYVIMNYFPSLVA
jgi:hypothetical protein